MTTKKQKRTRSKETGKTKNSSQRDVRNGSLQRLVRRHSGWALIECFFVLMIIGIVGFIVFVIGDYMTGTTRPENAVVVGKSYKPAETHTGVGTGVGANGQVATVVTTSSTSEEWNVIVRLGNGNVVEAKASSQQWAEAKEGNDVTVDVAIGGWSRSILGWTLQ